MVTVRGMRVAGERTNGAEELLVPAVDKAFKILDVLKGQDFEFTIVEIAKALNLNKSTVQKLLVTLSYYGVVQRDDATKRCRLGMSLAEYGSIVLSGFDLRRAAKPFLKSLMEYSGETACLGVLQGTKVVIVDKMEPPTEIRVNPHVGWRFAATLNVMGKAILAWLPPDRLDEILLREGLPVRTSKSITERAVYEADLRETRERGYATEWQEFHDSVNGVAAPIRDHRMKVVASIAVGGPQFRMTKEKMSDLGKKCIEAAMEISRIA